GVLGAIETPDQWYVLGRPGLPSGLLALPGLYEWCANCTTALSNGRLIGPSYQTAAVPGMNTFRWLEDTSTRNGDRVRNEGGTASSMQGLAWFSSRGAAWDTVATRR